jgi:hypothetical protein
VTSGYIDTLPSLAYFLNKNNVKIDNTFEVLEGPITGDSGAAALEVDIL